MCIRSRLSFLVALFYPSSEPASHRWQREVDQVVGPKGNLGKAAVLCGVPRRLRGKMATSKTRAKEVVCSDLCLVLAQPSHSAILYVHTHKHT